MLRHLRIFLFASSNVVLQLKHKKLEDEFFEHRNFN